MGGVLFFCLKYIYRYKYVFLFSTILVVIAHGSQDKTFQLIDLSVQSCS